MWNRNVAIDFSIFENLSIKFWIWLFYIDIIKYWYNVEWIQHIGGRAMSSSNRSDSGTSSCTSSVSFSFDDCGLGLILNRLLIRRYRNSITAATNSTLVAIVMRFWWWIFSRRTSWDVLFFVGSSKLASATFIMIVSLTGWLVKFFEVNHGTSFIYVCVTFFVFVVLDRRFMPSTVVRQPPAVFIMPTSFSRTSNLSPAQEIEAVIGWIVVKSQVFGAVSSLHCVSLTIVGSSGHLDLPGRL